jgi:hypothetical protein
MGTIGLAHRGHRDFVVDWLEPEMSASEPDEGLAERVEVVRVRARVRLDQAVPSSGETDLDEQRDEPEMWLAGEPTF